MLSAAIAMPASVRQTAKILGFELTLVGINSKAFYHWVTYTFNEVKLRFFFGRIPVKDMVSNSFPAVEHIVGFSGSKCNNPRRNPDQET
ncbi:hypothetical protein YC2023_094160 [Brassica napus]